MIAALLRQDILVKAICLLVLALHALPYGADFIYFRTFLLGPLLAAAIGCALGFFIKRSHAEVERDAKLLSPGFLTRALTPLSLVSLGVTLLVVAHNIHVGSYARFDWWPMVMGMMLGTNVGELLQNPDPES